MSASIAAKLSLSSSFSLSGRVAIVTGGSAGIGRAIAAQLVSQGAAVMLVARDSARLAAAAGELGNSGEVRYFEADVRDPESALAMIDRTADVFGRLDALVNNVGASTGDDFTRGKLRDLSIDDLLGAIRLNVGSAFVCSQAAIDLMKLGGGSIVNIASIAADTVVMPGFGLYSTAKAALIGLTRVMASELADHGIRVNAVLPGHIDTARTSAQRTERETSWMASHIVLGRLGEPSEVAGIVGYLVSDAGKWTTGSMFRVDGGSKAMCSIDGWP